MLRRLIISAGLVLASASAFAAEAGKVVFVVGKADLAGHAATLEAAVQEGDELRTGADGYIYMKTVDNGFLILRPNSRARVTAYHVDKANPANTRVKLELLNGVARSISGEAVKQARQNFRFNTPVAAIGVRGTDFIVYTNDKSSWVSVVSGGVIASNFAGACGPEGGGPCEGGNSRELFAGKPDVMLQIQRGQDVPQLLHNATISPELNSQPRSDEPVGKVAGAKSSASIGDNLNLDAAKPAIVLVPVKTPDSTPGTTTPPPVIVDKPEPPKVPEIIWGRWQAVAGLPVNTEAVDKISTEANKTQILLSSYIAGRPNNSTFVMPREGTASFAMTDGEATLSKNGGPAISASIQNAKLNIDFAAQSFTTSLSVVNSLGQVDVVSKGDVSQNGVMESSLFSQGFRLRGLLGGSNANEAVYIFKSTGEPVLSTAGITRWSR
jgi:hypothetical protein